jgi:hypothetical protein
MYKIYDHILQGSEATLENAIEHAIGFDFGSSEYKIKETVYPNTSDYKDTKNGIDIYYNSVANYYFFVEEKTQPSEDECEDYYNEIITTQEEFIIGGKMRLSYYYANEYASALRKFDKIAWNLLYQEFCGMF